MVCAGFGASSQKCVDFPVPLLLDEPTAAGGGLEFSRDAQMLGTPYPEPADTLDADVRGGCDAVGVGEALQGLK